MLRHGVDMIVRLRQCIYLLSKCIRKIDEWAEPHMLYTFGVEFVSNTILEKSNSKVDR